MGNSIKKIASVALTTSTVVWLTGVSALMPVALAQSTDISSLQAQIQQLQALLASLQTGGSTVVSTSACNFTRNLTVGMTGDDVKCLQQHLNAKGFQIAASGAGSPGNESMYFGSLTRAAVVKWQNANAACVLTPAGLATGTGYFGSQSRNCYSQMMVSTPTTPTTPTLPGVPSVPVGSVAVVGAMTVGLAADNPASSNVPKGAYEVPQMKLVFSGSGTINSLTFKRVGLGATTDFASAGVKLYEGSGRLTTGKTVNSTNHEVSFPNLNLQVVGSRVLMLTADLASTAVSGDINAFNLVKVNDQDVTASRINGNQMVVAGSTVGGIRVGKNGSLSNPNVGQSNAKLTQFRLTASSTSSGEDVSVRRIVLTLTGNISTSNLTNLKLRQAGRDVSMAAGVSGRDLFVFDLAEPFKMLKGEQRVFEVYGDISPLSRASDTIGLYVDVLNDVFATGSVYGYGVTVDREAGTSAFDSTSANHHSLTLQGAEVTVTFHGPAVRDIQTRGQDVTLFDFSIASRNNIEIKNLRFSNVVASIGAGEGFNDWKVVDKDTGAAVSSSVDITANASTTITDVVNVAAGQTRRFIVTADVDPDNDASDTIKVSLDAFSSGDIKNLDNNTNVNTSDIVPNSTIAGNTQTVKAVDLQVTLSATPSSHTAVSGDSNVDLVGFNFRAVNGSIKVTAMTLSASATTGTEGEVRNDVRTIGLYVDGVLVGSKENLTDDGAQSNATFTNLEISVPEGQTKRVVVKADSLATNATANNVYYVYINDMATEITAVDGEGNDITGTGSLTGTLNGADATAGTIALTVGTASLRADKVTDSDTDADLITGGGERLLAKFDLFAASANATVTKLKVGVASVTGGGADTSVGEEVDEIVLYLNGVKVASGLPSRSGVDAGRVKLENTAGLFTIPADTTKKLEVKAVLKSVTGVSGGADTGTNLVVYLGADNFEMISGTTSTTTLTNATSSGNTLRMYKSIPTISVAAPASTRLVNGSSEVMLVTVKADAAGDIEWARLEFTVSLTNASLTINTITLRDSSGTSLSLATTTIPTAGGEGVLTLVTPERIAAGQSKTYKLLLNVANSNVNGAATPNSSLVVNLRKDETSADTPDGQYDQEDDSDSFVWSDFGKAPHTTSTNDWHNGHLVKTLPSDAISLSTN